jgi:hypothetical protein
MLNLFDITPEVGDGVIVTTLPPANFPISGGFPYNRDEIATIIGMNTITAPGSGGLYTQYTVQWPPKNGYEFGPYTYSRDSFIVVRKHVK